MSEERRVTFFPWLLVVISEKGEKNQHVIAIVSANVS